MAVHAESSAAAAPPQPSSVHMTGTSAAVPEDALPSKSLAAFESDGQGQGQAGVSSGIAQRSSSQRATSFVGTADYVAPEVRTPVCPVNPLLPGAWCLPILKCASVTLMLCWSVHCNFGLVTDFPVVGATRVCIRCCVSLQHHCTTTNDHSCKPHAIMLMQNWQSLLA